MLQAKIPALGGDWDGDGEVVAVGLGGVGGVGPGAVREVGGGLEIEARPRSATRRWYSCRRRRRLPSGAG